MQYPWRNILVAAKIARVSPHDLREVLSRPPLPDLPDHLLDRAKWVDAATDRMNAHPMDYNSEKLAKEIYDNLVLYPARAHG